MDFRVNASECSMLSACRALHCAPHFTFSRGCAMTPQQFDLFMRRLVSFGVGRFLDSTIRENLCKVLTDAKSDSVHSAQVPSQLQVHG